MLGPKRTNRELIWKEKLQKYVKKGEPSRFRDDNKSQHEFLSRDEDHPFQPPQNVIGETTTIAGGPSTGGSFRSLKKACQRQVNNVHMVPPFKQS